MGWIKYIVPVGTLIVGLVLTKDSKDLVMPKIVQFLIILVCICSVMSLRQFSNNELNINDEFSDIISDAYAAGAVNKGGGAIGAIIAVPMSKVIGWASYVVLIGTRYFTYNIYIRN